MASLRSNPNEPFEKLKNSAAHARRPLDKDYWLNVAFFLGEHYVEWNAAGNNIQRIKRPTGNKRPRPVVNKINHFVSQQHALALQTKPTTDVLPATDDPSDISDALVARAYLQNVFDVTQMNFDQRLSSATFWALIAGYCDIKWCWDEKESRPEAHVVPFTEGYSDPYATDFDKSRWYVHSKFMDTEAVFDQWGVEVKQEEQQDTMKAQLIREMGQAPSVRGATVNELWMPPNRRHKEGIYCVWAGSQQLVPPRPYPYKHKKLPFSRIGVVQRPGSQYYDSHVKYLRPPQMELNKYHAQRIRVRENYASPKWWIPAEVELEVDPNDDPDQILRGSSPSGAKPELIEGRGFPDNREGDWISTEMMDVVGLHEVSQGQVPGRVESAKAVELLRESDTSRLQTLQETTRWAISRGGWQCLQLARQYGKPKDVLTTYSSEGYPEVKKFFAGDWKEGMRVRTTMDTGLGRSRASRNELLLNLWQNQIITDPEKMANLMDVPLDNMLSVRAFDIKLARNENLTLAEGPKGQAITPNSWDDHEIHLREHNNFRKTHDYLTLPKDAKEKFEGHCNMHEQLQINEISKQVKLQMLAQGAVPPGAPGQGPAQGGPSAQTAGQTQPGEAPQQERPPPAG